jgi:hypothetical protein
LTSDASQRQPLAGNLTGAGLLSTPIGVAVAWVALVALIGTLVACTPSSARPPAPPTASGLPVEQPLNAAETSTQAAAARATQAAATVTAQAEARFTVSEARAVEARSAATAAATPSFGLIGAQARACASRRVPFDIVVEEAEVADHPDGGLVIIAVVRVTNQGSESGDLFSSLRLVDRSGRKFDYRLVDRSFDLYTLRQKYDAREIHTHIQPGLSARQVWAYIVPPGVQGLKISPGDFQRCR